MGEMQYQAGCGGSVTASYLHAHQQIETPLAAASKSSTGSAYHSNFEKVSSTINAREEGWSCPTCTFFNKVSDYLACEICGEPKRSASIDVCADREQVTSLEDQEYQLRVREREEKVEEEHQNLINARLEEIIEMQHQLFGNPDAEPNTVPSDSERERELQRIEREREQQRLEREGELQRVEREREQLKLEEEKILKQQASLDIKLQELKQTMTNSTADARGNAEERELRNSIPTSGPGATTVPPPGAVSVSTATPSLLDRKYSKLEDERQQLEHQQRMTRQSQPGATAVAGVGSNGASDHHQACSSEKKLERLESERQQLLRQQQVCRSTTTTRPGARAVPGPGASSSQEGHDLDQLRDQRDLTREQQEYVKTWTGAVPSLSSPSRTASSHSAEAFPAPQTRSNAPTSVSSLTADQQQAQVQMLLQSQRNSDALQSQSSIQEPARVLSTRLPPTRTPMSHSRPRLCHQGQTGNLQERHLATVGGMSGSQRTEIGSGTPLTSSTARGSKCRAPSSSFTQPPASISPCGLPAPPPTSHAPPSPQGRQRKGRMSGLAGLMKRPSRRTPSGHATEQVDSSSGEFQEPNVPIEGRRQRRGRDPLRNSVADLAIADIDRIMDEPSTVWEKSTKRR